MPATDYARIEKAILFIEANVHRQPSLKDVAANVGLSEYHFQRLFRRWAGVSPKKFVQYLTAKRAEGLLRQSYNVLDVSDAVGLSGPGRLHDLIVNVHGVTPGQLKASGEGLTIRFGIHRSPFGECLVCVTDKGICGLEFIQPGGRDQVIAGLRRRWRCAVFQELPEVTRRIVDRVFTLRSGADKVPFDLFVKGSAFQLKVWEALLRIPPGAVMSYEHVAARIGAPRAARAVGAAVARNPVAFLIPCHRVIRKTGALGGYRWGETRKKAMLAWEAARRQASVAEESSVFSRRSTKLSAADETLSGVREGK